MRALSGTSVPIIAVVPGSASSFLRYFAPPSLGGVANFKSLDDEAARLGASSDELGEKVRYPLVTKARWSLNRDVLCNSYASTQRVR